MSYNGPKNVLFIVWDTCRVDVANSVASNLSELAAENVSFENAIAPASWSLPSHASVFTGKYPHEHDIFRVYDGMSSVPLVEHLNGRGYDTYGFSANGFAGPRMNIDVAFDEFAFTGGDEPYREGLDVASHVYRARDDEDASSVDLVSDLARATLTHPNRAKSVVNLLAAAAGRAAAKAPFLQGIPHPVFAPQQGYSYSPGRNTNAITSTFDRHRDGDSPFFIFANYMDPHTPYVPPARHQREQLGRTVPREERIRLNEEVALPWAFIELVESGELDESDVETLRGLYRAEVSSVDEHLGHVLDALKEGGLYEETIVVVTADHGENLGETDELGNRRMGHEASASEPLLRVPLVVANPELEASTVDDHVSIKDVFDLVEAVSTGDASTETVLESFASDGPVLSQYPALGGETFYDKHPSIPREILDHRVVEHTSVAYDDGWKVGMDTTGTTWALHEGEVVEVAEAPDELRGACEAALNDLSERADASNSLSDEELAQLEALGYM